MILGEFVSYLSGSFIFLVLVVGSLVQDDSLQFACWVKCGHYKVEGMIRPLGSNQGILVYLFSMAQSLLTICLMGEPNVPSLKSFNICS